MRAKIIVKPLTDRSNVYDVEVTTQGKTFTFQAENRAYAEMIRDALAGIVGIEIEEKGDRHA